MSAGRELRRVLTEVCGTVIAARDALSHYDAAIGDGDHGASMAKAFTSLRASLAESDEFDEATPKSILTLAGMTLLSAVGGAMGALLGTAFLDAAEAASEGEPVSAQAVADMLAAADAGVTRLGGAVPGDKTMIDALRPAAIAAAEAARSGGTVCGALDAAARAARRGADSTIAMQARVGRASRLGERSVGHPDPGAMSTALILETMAASASVSRHER